MTLIQLTGRINDAGELELTLPEGLPSGEVQVTLEIPAIAADDTPWEERPWTDEELAALSKIEPKTGAEVAAWLEQVGTTGWETLGKTGEEWVEEQRRKHQDKTRW